MRVGGTGDGGRMLLVSGVRLSTGDYKTLRPIFSGGRFGGSRDVSGNSLLSTLSTSSVVCKPSVVLLTGRGVLVSTFMSGGFFSLVCKSFLHTKKVPLFLFSAHI